jgi:hypothetical protein
MQVDFRFFPPSKKTGDKVDILAEKTKRNA